LWKNNLREKFEIFTEAEWGKISKMTVLRVMSPCSFGPLYTDDMGGALFFRNNMSAGLKGAKSQRVVIFTGSFMRITNLTSKSPVLFDRFCFYFYISI
jgi:hypothetical protein